MTKLGRSAELTRALRLYIAAANLQMRVMKARARKDAMPEYDQHYENAIAHLNKATEALKKISDDLRKH